MTLNSEKYNRLRGELSRLTQENVIVAFSGGVDSSLLLKTACDCAIANGTQVYAVTVQTTLHPRGDLAIAREVARETGASHYVLELDELEETGIADNPPDRCYRCKKGIFLKLKKQAEELGVRYILEGTNEDDLHEYRPGIKALRELGIISPLAQCGLSKQDIRTMALQLGISVADRPASPCLATRLPYGSHITYDLLKKIEDGETYIRELGFYNVRLRTCGNTARIEVDAGDVPRAARFRREITEHLKKLGFIYITLDLEGFRSGSMDAGIKENQM